MHSSNLELITALRHRLHQYPELSMEEAGTVNTLMAFLEEHTDFSLHQREGWFYARKEGGPAGRKIAFRADMDALPIQENIPASYTSCRPGISHKCGHDGHSAALCGLALELTGQELPHTVYLVFQPGEETGQGALLCRDLIRQEGIEEIYAFHNLPGYPLGSLVYREGLTQPASEGLRICFTGCPSHASEPEAGINPAKALARTALMAGEHSGGEPGHMRLCTVTGLMQGNGDFGISHGEGSLSLTLRAEQEAEMNQMEETVLAFAREQALAGGLGLESRIFDRFPETRNHQSALGKVLEGAKALKIPLVPMERLWRASEDFGHYLKECPGAMFYLGAGEESPALHTLAYDFNDALLPPAVDLFVWLAAAPDGP